MQNPEDPFAPSPFITVPALAAWRVTATADASGICALVCTCIGCGQRLDLGDQVNAVTISELATAEHLSGCRLDPRRSL